MFYDVIVIGAGPGGIFTAYELLKNAPEMKIALISDSHLGMGVSLSRFDKALKKIEQETSGML